MKEIVILLLFPLFIGTIHADTRIDLIRTNAECLSYVDSLIQVNRSELSYFNAVPLKEVSDIDFLIPELRNYISSNSLIGWEKFDLNQDGNMDLYFSLIDKYYQPIQGFVIGNKKNRNRIYLFDQFEFNTFENPIFQIQEKTNKKNEILNYRYSASDANSCTKIICTRLIFISGIGFLEIPQNNKLVKDNKLDYIIIKYYNEYNQVGEAVVDFKKGTLNINNMDIYISNKLNKEEMYRINTISRYSFANVDTYLDPCKQIFSHTKTTVYNLYLTDKKKIEIRDEKNRYTQSILLLKKYIERVGGVVW
jgi:hypothetical protein